MEIPRCARDDNLKDTHMKYKRTLMLLASLSSINSSYAFFCPSNFNQVDIGYTIDQVTLQCGAPDKEETQDPEVTVPQQWDYFVPQTVVVGNSFMQQQGTYTSFTFDASGKVMNISVNGVGMANTAICGPTLALGASSDQVKAACGSPGFISKQEAVPLTDMEKAANRMTIYTYTTGTPNNKPVLLIFQGDRLVEKK
jgi:hypothetical protein